MEMVFGILLAAFFGLMFGNYATTAFFRIPLGKPINGLKTLKGSRPHCSTCSHPLKFYEYLPFLSWFSTGFHCNYCGAKTDIIYTVLEVLGLISAILWFLLIGFNYLYIFLLTSWVTYFLFMALFIRYNYVYKRVLVLLLILLGGVVMANSSSTLQMQSRLPNGFFYLSDIDPTIVQDVKYAKNDNFMGRPVKGYNRDVIILTHEAALALREVQKELKPMGYSLKVFDGYRPQMAVEDFWEWANDPTDIENQAVYYPDFKNKVDLFNGYIARRSAHSRGSAVDLTIIDLAKGKELDMGERFDFLGERSNTAFEGISETAKDNRSLLKTIMEKHGFENYWREWWHYSLKGEPFTRTPEDHFNFPVE